MVAQSFAVAAGVRQLFDADAKRIQGVRLLDGRFMVINQAMATPKRRAAGIAPPAARLARSSRCGYFGSSFFGMAS